MKCIQKVKFQPITLIINTSEEAEAIWAALENRKQTSEGSSIVIDLANWFCKKAQLLNS